MPPRLVPLPLCVFVAASFPAFASTTVLPPTVVTATRSEKALDETPVRTEVVTGEEIRRTNARTLRDALENVPGLQLREIHGKSGFEVSLQGLGSDHVLVLVDGLPLAASTGSTVDVSQYLLGEVEHIEVVKGASSAQYGSSAMGGVINIITRRIKPGLAGELVADAGTYGRQNHSGDAGDIGSAHGQFRIEGGGEQVQARLVVDSLDSAGFGTDPAAWTRQGDAVRREQAGGRLAWQPSARSELWLDGSAYREQATQRYLYFVPPLSVPQRKTEQIERQRRGGGGSWRFDNKASLRLTGLDERYESHSRAYSNDYLVTDRRSTQQNRYLGLQFDPPGPGSCGSSARITVRKPLPRMPTAAASWPRMRRAAAGSCLCRTTSWRWTTGSSCLACAGRTIRTLAASSRRNWRWPGYCRPSQAGVAGCGPVLARAIGCPT